METSDEKKMSLLKFVAAGSVDDGKSTLIGRLLYDSGQVYEDQLEALERHRDAEGNVDLSLLTDGLAAEREQKITIDVAYRYFSMKRRRYVIADVPGHEQYTKNMVTGASHAQVALILIDARKGLLIQTKRHLSVASLLGIPHIAIVVNKMDLVDYDEAVFEKIKQQVSQFTTKLSVPDLHFIPSSAYKGDMVVVRGEHMPWYTGWTVMDYLEHVEVEGDRNLVDFRLPIQLAIRPNQNFRGYAGTVEGGQIRVGEEVMALPSKKVSRVAGLVTAGNEMNNVFSPQATILSLKDELDISRGDMLVRPKNQPHVTRTFEAMLFWFSPEEMRCNKKYILKHTTKLTGANIDALQYELNIDDLHRQDASALGENGIGKVIVTTKEDLCVDPYNRNKNTGSFILIDDVTKHTIGAGIILKAHEAKGGEEISLSASIPAQTGGVLWLTGLSGSGKSTIGDALHEKLISQGVKSVRLDGDILRASTTVPLGFDERDRRMNIDMAAFAAEQLAKQGFIVIASFISPYRDQREAMKSRIPNFKEIYIATPLEECEIRDVKGLYKKARAGEIEKFTGISDPYEAPASPDLEIDTYNASVESGVDSIIQYMRQNGLTS